SLPSSPRSSRSPCSWTRIAGLGPLDGGASRKLMWVSTSAVVLGRWGGGYELKRVWFSSSAVVLGRWGRRYASRPSAREAIPSGTDRSSSSSRPAGGAWRRVLFGVPCGGADRAPSPHT